MEPLFLLAFGLNLTLWAVPGAVTTEVVRRGLTRGVWSVLCIQLGSLVGDALWAIAAFIGAVFLMQNTLTHLLLGAVETLVLFSLAWNPFKEVWTKSPPHAKGITRQGDIATKTVVSTWAKLTGMRWTSGGLDAILALRTAVLNQTYDSF